jgi:hypothetical protein
VVVADVVANEKDCAVAAAINAGSAIMDLMMRFVYIERPKGTEVLPVCEPQRAE